jgi:hypothetical protein
MDRRCQFSISGRDGAVLNVHWQCDDTQWLAWQGYFREGWEIGHGCTNIVEVGPSSIKYILVWHGWLSPTQGHMTLKAHRGTHTKKKQKNYGYPTFFSLKKKELNVDNHA